MNYEALNNIIKLEYKLILIAFLVYLGLLLLGTLNATIPDKNEGFGSWRFAVAIIMNFAMYIVLGGGIILFCVANPIRIMIQHFKLIQEVEPSGKMAEYIILILLPLLLVLITVLFGKKIAKLYRYLVYKDGKDAYPADPETFITPGKFVEELRQRGLYFEAEDEALIDKLNSPYQDDIEKHGKSEYYEKASIKRLALEEEIRKGVDNECLNERNSYICTPDEDVKAPGYYYNSVLILPKGEDRLRYAPVGRYVHQENLRDIPNPYKDDYYIECKIFCIDSKIYALIGLGESKIINEAVKGFRKPFYIILAEEDHLTTYFKGTYYPYGSIAHHYHEMEIYPNVLDGSKWRRYPVRKVDRVDLDAINRYCRELQEGILKDSIEEYLRRI